VEIVKRHPVIAYFVLACVLTWWMFPLLRFSPLLGLFGLFGPALAAIIMAAAPRRIDREFSLDFHIRKSLDGTVSTVSSVVLPTSLRAR
jgi:hypothetical protein